MADFISTPRNRLMLQGMVLVFLKQQATHQSHVVAKSVNEGGLLLLEVPHLHQRTGKVQVGNVGRLPAARLFREAAIDHKFWLTRLVENRVVEAKPGTTKDAVIFNFLDLVVGMMVADANR